jgi:hypothetical protein
MAETAIPAADLPRQVQEILAATPLTDIHTHTFDPAFGPLCLWGIDELLTYHYLVAEVFRARPDLDYEGFWKLAQRAQADLIWNELFIKRSPVSEACRGVLTVLHKLGLDTNTRSLAAHRRFFAGQKLCAYIDTVFRLAGLRTVYMTNDPLNPLERAVWEKGFDRDPRFLAVVRLDSALMNWPQGAVHLRALGYDADAPLNGRTLGEVRRYLRDWCARMQARYLAISLPPTFAYPDPQSPLTTLLTKAAAPVARELGLPIAMMIGVRKLANRALRLAGDSVGKADTGAVERLAADFADIRFLITMLARENTHELCVAARKFKNILPFGCWWFLNNPSLIAEITAMRLETLGLSFIPQHSDARVLDQLIYKWEHSRPIVAAALARKYAELAAVGRALTPAAVRRDISRLFTPDF